MNDFEEKLTANFSCLKCRGKSAVAKTIPLNRGLPDLLTLSSEKYILVSCTLCGFTEIYNPHAFAQEEEPVRETTKLAQEL